MIEVAAVAGQLGAAGQTQRLTTRDRMKAGCQKCDARSDRGNFFLHRFFPRSRWKIVGRKQTSGVQLVKFLDRRDALLQFVAKLFRLREKCLLVVAALVAEAYAQRADRLAGSITQWKLHPVTLIFHVYADDRLAGVDHLHVVVVRLLADAPEVRGDDDVVLGLRRGNVHGEHDDFRVPRKRVVDELLRVRLGRRERLVRVELDEIGGIEYSLRQPVTDSDGLFL